MKILPALLFFVLTAPLHADPNTVKVFILAGQSNMEGQAVVDLAGKDYNDGKGTLAALLADPAKAPQFQHLKDKAGHWAVRDDVFVRYQREGRPLLAGPLGVGFAVYGDAHHFGPELQFGHVVGDHFADPVLLIKTAWGGKSLYVDFRPPSAGGESGKYYKLMLQQVRESLSRIDDDFPPLKGRTPQLTGVVWYQGWNDGVDPKHAIPEYERNLVHLIHDVRHDLNAPNLPFVIGELTGPWVTAPGAWDTLRKAQAAAANRPEFAGNVCFVPTHDFVRKPEDSPNPSHGHHEFGNAETYFLVGDALGKGMLDLLSPHLKAELHDHPLAVSHSALQLTSPHDYQVFQRRARDTGAVLITGDLPPSATALEYRTTRDDTQANWQSLPAVLDKRHFSASIDLPAGGWHRLELRANAVGGSPAEAAVPHVGVGEVFIVAGQSNSANYGEEKQHTTTGLVSASDGARWQLADDPQPGAGGKAGSFMPPLGDALVAHFHVPVAFVPCGIGATSVREWLPRGVPFPNPPTILSRVHQRPDGQWESDGRAFDALAARMTALGPQGFRAVLWHQGESDANQKDPTRTLPGDQYRADLETIIKESRRQIGRHAPWFVAQAAYHTPDDPGSDDIRAAQASLWHDGIALQGPDTDALGPEYRERNGKGVHFSAKGLQKHADLWSERITPWLESQLKPQ